MDPVLSMCAREEDGRIKAHARPSSLEDNQKALDEPERIAKEAPDFANARWHVWQSEATKEAYVVAEYQLLVAATLFAAEFEVSRSLDTSVAEAYIFKVIMAADTRITGYAKRRDPISFVAAAT